MQTKMELVHIPKNRNEDYGKIVMVNDSFSEETIHASKDQYCLNNENFIDIQGVAGSIPEIFFTNKQVCSKYCSVSKIPQEDAVLMREKAIEIAPELNQIKKYLQTYTEQTKFLQSINEKLMTTNKRLQEDLEEKEVDYQKLLSISKDILKEKRTIQKKFEHMKTQSKEAHNQMQNKDAEFSRLQRISQVLSDLTVLAEDSKSLQTQSHSFLLKAIRF